MSQNETFHSLRASHFVYNSWQHRRRDHGRACVTTAVVSTEGRINICTCCVFQSQRGSVWGECSNRISDANFL